jgi:glycosyltransferase involved in cell wall biosynthesis
MSATPKVSVCITAYNHEAYIREAIDSVLAQKVNFPIEILIGEDCSTDGTRAIVQQYERNHPDLIRAFIILEKTRPLLMGV